MNGSRWGGAWARLVDLLFPLRCLGCGRPGEAVCARCRASVEIIRVACPTCGSPGPGICATCRRRDGHRWLRGARAACVYEGLVRQAVLRFKFRRARYLGAFLGDLLVATLEARPIDVDVLVPVPSRTGVERERGYHHTDLLAEVVGWRLGLPVERCALVRQRDTLPQVGLDARQRWSNVRGAFRCVAPDRIAGRRVLLVDDILTTGATAESCARALATAGASGVWALVVARDQLARPTER